MSIARAVLLSLTLVPAGASAQAVVHRSWVDVPDLRWIGPVVAQAQAHAAAALASAGPAMTKAQAGLNQAGPALARAQGDLRRAGPVMAQAKAGISRAFLSYRLDFAASDFAESAPAPWAQQDPADSLYRTARSALNRGRYADASTLFESVYTRYPKSAYAADAYYWQAYALRRRGGDESLKKALDVLAIQQRRAPNASTRSDADALSTRICGELARSGDERCAAIIATTARGAMLPPTPPNPAHATAPVTPPTPADPVSPKIAGSGRSHSSNDHCDSEDDMQTAALNALLQMDGDKAIPILRKVLARRDEGSLCLRRKAVFLVSQHEGAETERILLEVARTDPDLEVREQAVQWLSQVDSPGAVAALDSILRSAGDAALQDKAIFALSQQDSPKARQALRDFALRAGVSEDLREKAIFWIGQGDDPDRLGFLKSLYGQMKNQSARDKILFSVSQIEGRESQRWLITVASDPSEDIELRKKALFWVGQSDIPVSELFTLYEKMPSREMKEQMIFVYSQRDEKAAVDKLLQIARTETDRELRKKAIFWLSQSDDPRVADFLASLLEKPPQE